MTTTYYITIAVHVVAAVFWLGGMLFLGVIGAPVLRGVEPVELRQRLFHTLGVRFRAAGWIAIGVLLATGVLILQLRGLLRWSGGLGDAAFWNTTFGHSLAIKLGAVVVMLAGSVAHDFVLGPAAGRAVPCSPAALTLRRRASIIARINAFAGIVVLVAAVQLARPG